MNRSEIVTLSTGWYGLAVQDFSGADLGNELLRSCGVPAGETRDTIAREVRSHYRDGRRLSHAAFKALGAEKFSTIVADAIERHETPEHRAQVAAQVEATRKARDERMATLAKLAKPGSVPAPAPTVTTKAPKPR